MSHMMSHEYEYGTCTVYVCIYIYINNIMEYHIIEGLYPIGRKVKAHQNQKEKYCFHLFGNGGR